MTDIMTDEDMQYKIGQRRHIQTVSPELQGVY